MYTALPTFCCVVFTKNHNKSLYIISHYKADAMSAHFLPFAFALSVHFLPMCLKKPILSVVSGDLLVIEKNKMLGFFYFLYYLFRLRATMGGKIGRDSYQRFARIPYEVGGEQGERRALHPSETTGAPGILVR